MKIIANIPEKAKIPILRYSKINTNKEFSVLFVGDISFAENYVKEYETRPNIGFNILEHYGYDYFFEKLKQALFDAEVVIANLETPLLDIKHTPRPLFPFSTRYDNKQGRFQHWSDSNITPIYLKKYNIANVSLANNHMLDYGIEGLYQTLESLNNNQIRFFGAGYNRKQARAPFIKKILIGNQNMKLIVFSAFEYRKGYDKDFEFYASHSKGGVNRLSFTAITKKIKRLRENEENIFIVIFPHWGGSRNYGWKTEYQTEMGHKLIDAGADLIIGHGPHNLQQIEKYNEHWIIYSLGNFVYNSYGNYDKYNAPPYGGIVKLTFSAEQYNNPTTLAQDISKKPIIKSMKIYPIVTDNHLTKFQTRFVNEKEFEYIYKYLINNRDFWKPSEQEAKYGIDRVGRFIELLLE